LGLALCAAPRVSADEAPSPSAPASAGLTEAEINRRADVIASSIMSPFCPGRTVESCPHAEEWRADIRTWVAQGVDAEEIKRRLHERVPAHDLFGVPANGVGWPLPVGIGLGAAGFLVFLLRYLVGKKPGANAAATGSSGAQPKEPRGGVPRPGPAEGGKSSGKDDLDSRLEDELETLDG